MCSFGVATAGPDPSVTIAIGYWNSRSILERGIIARGCILAKFRCRVDTYPLFSPLFDMVLSRVIRYRLLLRGEIDCRASS